MTPRQAQTERRAAERKTKKAEIRRNKQVALEFDDDLPLEDEFSPEELARGRAAAARIDREVALKMAARRAAANQPHDQNPEDTGLAQTPDFVSQNTRASINRANSQHSTGPRTPIGKLASSRNSLKHGLASGELIIPGEDASAFEALLTALLDEHQPVAATEELLINEMAQSHWLAQRALRLQNECFTGDSVDDKRLSLYMRYHTTHQRAFHKALAALMKLKKEQARAFQESGFVSQSAQRAAAKSGFVSQKPYQNPDREGGEPPESEFVPQKEQAEAA